MSADNWFALSRGDVLTDGENRFRFRRDPVPCISTAYSCRHRYRSYRMIGYLRARADRETGGFVRIGRMEEFRGVHDENGRRTDKSWKNQSRRKHQWK